MPQERVFDKDWAGNAVKPAGPCQGLGLVSSLSRNPYTKQCRRLTASGMPSIKTGGLLPNRSFRQSSRANEKQTWQHISSHKPLGLCSQCLALSPDKQPPNSPRDENWTRTYVLPTPLQPCLSIQALYPSRLLIHSLQDQNPRNLPSPFAPTRFLQ